MIQQKAKRLHKSMDRPTFRYGLSLWFPIKEDLDVELGKEEIEVEGGDLIDKDPIIDTHFMTLFDYTENKLTAMHAAYAKPLLIYIPENEERKITIRTCMKESAATHFIVVAERNSTAEIVEMNEAEGGKIRSHAVEAFLMEGAKVSYESMQDLDAWHFSIKRAVVSKDAEMNWFTATLGNAKVEVSTDLTGEGARTTNYGLFLGQDDQKFDTCNRAIHSSPNTWSDMDSKGIVRDEAKSIYRGLIKIREKAGNSNGYQKQDTLILSDEAEADAIPNLEIDNNEVRCSHGATIGQVDEEKIFYMMSRGLSRKEAEREIVRGFLGSMADKVRSDVLRKELWEKVEGRL